MILGYARVSTAEQEVARQRDFLADEGAHRVYIDTESGMVSTRPELAKMLVVIRDGDCVIAESVDRLGRSMKDLLALIDDIEKRGGYVRIVREGIDTRNELGRLLMSVKAAFAEYEVRMLRSRTRDGLAAAKRRGKKLGPKYKLDAHQRSEARRLVNEGTSQADVARLLDVHPSTISRILKEPK